MMKDLNAMIAKANAMEHFSVDSKFYNDEGGYAPGAKESLPKVMKAVAAYLAPNGVAADMGIMPGSSVHKILFGTREERREVANIMRTYVMQTELMDNEDVLHAVRDWVKKGELRNIRPVWTRIAEIINLKPEDGVKNGEVWRLINSVVLIERISEDELSRNTRLVMMILEAYGCNGWIDGDDEWMWDMPNIIQWSFGKLNEFIGDDSVMDNEWSCAMNMISIGDWAVRIARMEEIDISGKSLIMGGTEINAQPRAGVEWLVDGVIPKTVDSNNPYIGFLYGNSSTYKSFIATGICSAVVKAGEFNPAGFAGLAAVSGEGGRVLYLSGEDSYGVRVRFEAEFGGMVPQGVKMNLAEMDTIYGKDDELDFKIMMCIEDFAPDLVVLDTMNSLKLCENNNSSAAVSKMMHKLKSLGTTVMIVHHSTKGGDSMEGSHAMFSNADFVLRTDVVEREDDVPVVDLSCGKLKNAAKFKPMRIELVAQEESLVCRNHKSYEEAREAEAEKMGLESVMARLIAESGEHGMTVAQMIKHDDVKYTASRQALSKKIDRCIDGKDEGWEGIVKVSRSGLETKYILESEYNG
ncbi:hypothetical protein VP168E361_P0061 [Vibrio phage 168E36-1]|nr:hypothetical protein VP168E361_P0061 [Vibrio phage 168E36-1]